MNAPHNARKPGDLDLAFGESGLAPYPAGLTDGEAGLLSNGKIISAATDATTPIVTVFRHLETGAPDTSFGEQGSLRIDLPDGELSPLAKLRVLPDDSVLVYGPLTQGTGHRSYACRILPDGQFDQGFGEAGFCIMDMDDHGNFISTMIPLSDGKVAALVTASRSDGYFGSYIVRLVDGRFDPTFGESGSGYIALDPGPMHHLAESASRSYLVVPRPDPGYGIVRQYLENGNVDFDFGFQGQYLLPMPTPSSQMFINELKVLSDGRILIVGQANVGFGTHTLTMRLNPDGHPDPTFNNGEPKIMVFQGYETVANDIAQQADGKMVIVGNTTTAPQHVILMRLEADGRSDMSFGINGQVISDLGSNALGRQVSIQSDGKLLVSGTLAATQHRMLVARYLG